MTLLVVRLRLVYTLLITGSFKYAPPKRGSAKRSKQSAERSLLEKFCTCPGVPLALMEVLEEHQITTKTVLVGKTEQDLSDNALCGGA